MAFVEGNASGEGLSYLSNVLSMTERYATVRYLCGAALARCGDETAGPALLLAALAVTGPTAAALPPAALLGAAAVGGPLFGVLLDRARRPGPLLCAALLGYAGGLGLTLLSLGRLPLGGTLVLAALTGLCGPALSGGWTSRLPGVVPAAALPEAVALDATTFTLAGLLGPALAGLAAGLLGPTAGVLVALVLLVLALPAALRLPAGPVPVRPDNRVGAPRQDILPGPPGKPARKARTTFLPRCADLRADLCADLAAGLRVLLHTPALARATTVSTLSCAAAGALMACAPLLGERTLGGAAHGTALLSAGAVSALLMGALLARHPDRVRPDTLVWTGALLLALALLLATVAHPAALVAAVLLAGAGEGPQLAALLAVRHREAPARLRGQVFTTGASLKIAAYGAGAGLAGPLAARSLPGTLVLAAGTAFTAVAAHAVFPQGAAAAGQGLGGGGTRTPPTEY